MYIGTSYVSGDHYSLGNLLISEWLAGAVTLSENATRSQEVDRTHSQPNYGATIGITQKKRFRRSCLSKPDEEAQLMENGALIRSQFHHLGVNRLLYWSQRSPSVILLLANKTI